jgi:predicted transport protein
MSFQAYIDNIKVKTGKTPEDFKKLAEAKGLLKSETKVGEVIAWLKKDFDLGHGHAMAIYTTFKGGKAGGKDNAGAVDKHFAGEKEKWRTVYDALLKKITAFGKDVATQPVASYISILRGERKFAVVQITKDRMTIGIKLKNQQPTDRFEEAGKWNTMMTHKTAIISSNEMDKELYSWLQKAYEQNAPKKA